MRILALETSTEYCSCALADGVGIRELFEKAGQRHSTLLLPMAQRLLADAGLTFGQVDAIAFGAGPGSFTGLRIACSVAQGLAMARDLPVVPIGTLEALAEEAGAERVIACLDARMGELYLAGYERQGDRWHAEVAPCLVRPDALPEMSGRWVGAGSGFAVQAERLAAAYDLASVDSQAFPRARAIAVLGSRALTAGGGVSAEIAAPLYLRDKVALDVREQAASRAARKAA
jgi:tRNA threonylcarbamoyladenosine biosynthesis protein TsaB